MILDNTNPVITKYSVNAVTHALTELELNGQAVDLVDALGVITLEPVTMEIPSAAGKQSVSVTVTAVGETTRIIGAFPLEITFTE